ncbi:SRPK3 [Symbiodinium sp. CCMP2592]|nr:SRPK3 [Symbiodinium sp. CCMP2592]
MLQRSCTGGRLSRFALCIPSLYTPLKALLGSCPAVCPCHLCCASTKRSTRSTEINDGLAQNKAFKQSARGWAQRFCVYSLPRLCRCNPNKFQPPSRRFGTQANNPVTDDIQTRQYRSPEVIIGAKWDETADVWSAACMFFELATGDYLFDPKKGEDWNREEDHLALIAELLGDLPTKEFALSGRYSKDFFNNAAKLKHIKKLKMWPLEGVLQEKYRWEEAEALEMADFLLPMLTWQPSQRQAASEALKHAWVQPRNGETDTWHAPPVPQRCDGEKTEQVSESVQEAPASPTTPEEV